MGVVYEAHDPVLSRDIALKVIQLGFSPSEEVRQSFEQRFFAEARAAARLSHPGILVVHDVGRDADSGALFMALELLRGETLDQALKARGSLDWREALRIAQRVAAALQHAHAVGVVHRDIKPANIMLLPSGEPKIMDFGIAKIETSQLTASGQFLGTPLYMSPEQALAHPVDGRSDLFSLGSVLYEMLTGRQAFAGESVTKIVFQIVSREPELATVVSHGLPVPIDYLLARCLAKDLARRYPDGLALTDDIEDVLAGRPPRGQSGWQPAVQAQGTVIRPAPAAHTPARIAAASTTGSPARSGLTVGVVAGVVAAAGLIGGVLLLRSNDLPSPAPVARRVPATPLITPAPSATPSPEMGASDPGETPPSPVPPSSIARAEVRKQDKDERSKGSNEDRQDKEAKKAKLAVAPARLLIDFEHSLKSGILRVWVDDEPVVEEKIGGRVTRDIAGIKFHKGRHSDTLEVAPGRREVRVQVAWEDSVKTESSYANFESGGTFRLKAKLTTIALRKSLSLEWQ